MGTLIVSLILAGMFGLAVKSLYKGSKSGGCCGGCSGCAGSCGGASACSCSIKPQNKE